MQSSRKGNLLFLLVSLVFLTSIATAATWNINTISEPWNRLDVSNNTSTVKVIELVDGDGDPVTQSQLNADEGELNYTYNKTNGVEEGLDWLHSGYYYTEFGPNASEGDYIMYELDSESSDYTAENKTQQMSIGNMTVELSSGNKDYFSDPVKFGESFTANVSVTDEWNDTNEDGAKVYAYFTNLSESESEINTKRVELGWNNGYYTNQMNVPDVAGSKFIFWVHANGTGLGYDNQFGSSARVIETLPQIQGRVNYLNATSGCDSESFFTACEWGTSIDTGYNITESTAEQVNLSLLAQERSTDNWVKLSSTTLSEEEGLYQGSARIPDLNTSKYQKTVRLKYNASNKKREHIDTYDVDYRSYKIQEKGDLLTSPGEYTVKVEFTKYFSPSPLNSTRIDGIIDIEDPSGDDFTAFTVEEMTYDQNRGVMKKDINIPFDAETGIYDINISVNNPYGDWKQEMGQFNVSDIQRTFNLTEDEYDIQIDHRGHHEFNITVENLLTDSNSLNVTMAEEFGDGVEVEVNGGSEISLDSEEEKEVKVSLNVSEVKDYTGDIKLRDESANFNDTVEVDLEAPNCDYTGEDICVRGSINGSADEAGYVEKLMFVNYLAEDNSSIILIPSSEGNISDILSFDPSTAELNESNRLQTITANYSANQRGYFTGTVELENITIPVSFDSNVESTELAMEVTESLDLGTVPETETVTAEVEIENTGTAPIETVSFDSISMTLSPSEIEDISVGSSETVEMEISEIAGSGTISVTAISGEKEATSQISVDVETVPNLAERADELESSIRDLQTQVERDENQNKLNTASLNVSEIKNTYQEGDYERAQRIYQATESSLNEVRRSVESSSDPGSSPDSPSTDPNSQQQSDSGGGMLPLIAAVVFILLIIGFVAFTSLIPEEGDPLYSVLGK